MMIAENDEPRNVTHRVWPSLVMSQCGFGRSVVTAVSMLEAQAQEFGSTQQNMF